MTKAVSQITPFSTLNALAHDLRDKNKKCTVIFAYNGTGKTRLSIAFKEMGKQVIGEETVADTLYYNAFTEDLFTWDNDLENDTERQLKINPNSRFFNGLPELEMENRIRPVLREYCDFDFGINYEDWTINFTSEVREGDSTSSIENIKISRGEERLFVWCFFLVIAQLAIDGQEAYNWVKYIYIDDPISSLDDNHAIAVAHHLVSRLLNKDKDTSIKFVISTHHALFFNVLCNELGNARKIFLSKDDNGYQIKYTHDSPFIYHISIIQQLKKAVDSGQLYTYHFNILRNVLEKAANFHGFSKFDECLKVDNDDEEGSLHTRMVNIFSHAGYSLFEPTEMTQDNKDAFISIFYNFLKNYKFNEQLFEEKNSEETNA